jgi:hypothetical protein
VPEAAKLFGVIANPALLPQAAPGNPGFHASNKRTSVLPVATGQTSVAATGSAVVLHAISKNISVLK